MNVHILSPEEKLFQGKASVLTLPGEDGSFQILPQHAPIVASLADGDILIKNEKGEEEKLFIRSGFIEVLNNTVNILVQGAKPVSSE
ncbi:MAG: ATP synthase F1 subunit epsilon [Bacteroidetes bacterium]|nr:ATP synthase F1 subunit epsilon [Bacteroidota bacterium]